MYSCNNCGNEISEQAAFCPNCGLKVAGAKANESENQKTANDIPEAAEQQYVFANAANNASQGTESSSQTSIEPSPETNAQANYSAMPAIENSYPQSSTVNPQPAYQPTGMNNYPPVQKQKSKKALMIAAGVACIVMLSLVLTVSTLVKKSNEQKIKDEYLTNLYNAIFAITDGEQRAYDICDLTQDVWYNSIQKKSNADTNEYTIQSSKYSENKIYYSDSDFWSDFNYALAAVAGSDFVRNSSVFLEASKKQADEYLKLLQNPPEEFQTVFGTLNNLYNAFSLYTSLALSATGSYNSYAETVRSYTEEFEKHANLIKLQLPNSDKTYQIDVGYNELSFKIPYNYSERFEYIPGASYIMFFADSSSNEKINELNIVSIVDTNYNENDIFEDSAAVETFYDTVMNTAKVTSAKEKKVIDFNGKKAAYILLDIPSDGKTVEAYYFIHNGNIYVIQCKYYSTATKDELAFYHDIMSTLVFK